MKSISTINPAIMENMECSMVEVQALFYWFKVSVSLNHGVLIRLVSLLAVQICWTMFVPITLEAPLLALHLHLSPTTKPYTSYSLIFTPITQCYKQRTTWKASLQPIQLLRIIRNARSFKACALVIDIKVGVLGTSYIIFCLEW